MVIQPSANESGPPSACLVANARPFNLYDIGAEITEQPVQEGPARTRLRSRTRTLRLKLPHPTDPSRDVHLTEVGLLRPAYISIVIEIWNIVKEKRWKNFTHNVVKTM